MVAYYHYGAANIPPNLNLSEVPAYLDSAHGQAAGALPKVSVRQVARDAIIILDNYYATMIGYVQVRETWHRGAENRERG